MLDGCPSDDFTQLSPRINLEDRFKTETLKFPSGDFVYIQCDVLVCDLNIPNDPECQSTCRAPVGPQQVDVDRVSRFCLTSFQSELENVVSASKNLIHDRFVGALYFLDSNITQYV